MRSYCNSATRFLILATTAIVSLLHPVFAQEPPHRLILKDGTYQLVTKYEIKGDRVHYYSAERGEWEDLPSSLVDWPATNQYEKDRAAVPEAVQLDKEASDEAAEPSLPEVVPGLRLPEDSGVFLLDTFNSEPQLVELRQSEGDFAHNSKGNIVHGNPISGAKMNIELNGVHASVQSHVGIPSFYINVDDGGLAQPQATKDNANKNSSTPQANDRFRILHAEAKGNKRILGDVKRAITGKISQEQHFVKTTTTNVNGGWLKLTPTESLPPGEYAIVEIVPDQGFNLSVWDFGVNPNAPANANPWKPTPPAKRDGAKSN
ncbi:MAG TPA: hypothetical protein VFO39_08725 [Candidatus Sulfotelmatobacter sp.]|nr:hypothetical protein [Candidatus Sulfotelmatobacter sp.]